MASMAMIHRGESLCSMHSKVLSMTFLISHLASTSMNTMCLDDRVK